MTWVRVVRGVLAATREARAARMASTAQRGAATHIGADGEAPLAIADAPPIAPAAADAPYDFPEFVEMLAALSPGDMSVNEAAAARPGSTMGTSAGSPNDLLWSRMETFGGARRVALGGLEIPGTRAFQFTEGGTKAIAVAFRVLLARRSGALPMPDDATVELAAPGTDESAAELMAPVLQKRAHLLDTRKKMAKAVAYLETVKPKTAERQAKKADLMHDSQAYLRCLDAAIGALNDAIAAGVNKFGTRFIDRAKFFIEAAERVQHAANSKDRK